MRLTIFVSVAAVALCTAASVCVAQGVRSTIYLSSVEIARVKPVAQELERAQERQQRATTAWQNFVNSYQTAHPDLRSLLFTSDFRFAVAHMNPTSPLGGEVAAIELSAEDQHKAETLHREMVEGWQVLEAARKHWHDCKIEFIAEHFASKGSGVTATLYSSKSVTIPPEWSGGALFTPDFRIAISGH